MFSSIYTNILPEQKLTTYLFDSTFPDLPLQCHLLNLMTAEIALTIVLTFVAMDTTLITPQGISSFSDAQVCLMWIRNRKCIAYFQFLL